MDFDRPIPPNVNLTPLGQFICFLISMGIICAMSWLASIFIK